MDNPRRPEEPITYVGGLGEAPRGPIWPFFLLGLIPVAALLAGLVFWNPIKALGRSTGETIAPYSMVLQSGGWSSDQKIATVPITLSLTLQNSDQRRIDGITWRFTQLDKAWEIVGSSSSNTPGTIAGRAIHFSNPIRPGGTATFAVTLLPTKAMDSDIHLTLTPDHSNNPAHIEVATGTVTSTLVAGGKVRDPVDSDADARLTAFYDPQPAAGNLTVWDIHIANTGPITINGVRLRFPNIPTGLDLQVNSQATVLPDGQTVQFDTTLVPGGQTVLELGVTPHLPGRFHIPVLVFLGKATQPLSSANGGPPLNIELTVN